MDKKEIRLEQQLKHQSNQISTHFIDTPERKLLRNKISMSLLNQGSFHSATEDYSGEVRNEKRLDIVIGIPAAGKSSSLVNPISDYYKSLIIDSDMAKELLPEYDGGLGADRVHIESKNIVLNTYLRAIEKEMNIVVAIVGRSLSSIEKYRNFAKSYGYSCHLHLNEISKETAMIRAMERFRKTGRFVSPTYILEVGDKPKENYEKLKLEKKFESYSRWSNEVAFGTKPILLESCPEEFQERNFMFTKEELKKVDEISIMEYVLNQGFHVKKTGKDYKVEELSGGCYIDIEKNAFKWWGKDKGGKIISFVMELEGKNWVEAVKTILNTNLTPKQREEFANNFSKKEEFILPRSKKNVNPHATKRAFAYLVKTRKLDPEIVSSLMKKGNIYEDERSNVVFVGKDKNNVPKYAYLRGTNPDKRFLGEVEGSKKEYSFSLQGTNKILYLFESPIDLLSYQSLLKKDGAMETIEESHFLSLGGVSLSALDQYLQDYEIDTIICCLDNDEDGKRATSKIAHGYSEKYEVKEHFPEAKDFNIQLCNLIEEEKLLIQEEKSSSFSQEIFE